MTTISQRNTGSVWDKRARYIEQSTSALQRYVAMGDTAARHTKMREYTPQQAREADISLYNRLLSDEQRTGPGKMPERSSGTAHTSETTGWGKKHLAISGVSHQPLVQTGHHSGAISVGLPMDNTPSMNITASLTSGYYTSSLSGSEESASDSIYSSLKSIKIGSSEAPSSWWSDEKMPVVDEYQNHRLRDLYINNAYEDEPVAKVLFEPNDEPEENFYKKMHDEIFGPNVKYAEADPHYDLHRASTSESPRPPVKNGVTGRSKSRQRRLDMSTGIIKYKGQKVRFGTKRVRGMTPKEDRIRKPEGVGRGF